MLKDTLEKIRQLDVEIGVLIDDRKKLEQEKAKYYAEVIEELHHNKDGQKSYDVDEYKVTVKTPNDYKIKLPRHEVEELLKKLPQKYNCFTQEVKYKVDKKLYDEFIQTASKAARNILDKLVEIKPRKETIEVGFIKK